jgi:hypothetical protein
VVGWQDLLHSSAAEECDAQGLQPADKRREDELTCSSSSSSNAVVGEEHRHASDAHGLLPMTAQ